VHFLELLDYLINSELRRGMEKEKEWIEEARRKGRMEKEKERVEGK
jgi:hypothetical protein